MMNANQQVINRFYAAFQERDYKTMQQCYAGNARFTDAIFQNLNAAETKAMWQMLCTNASADFRLEFGVLAADKNTVKAQWTAWYTFSATGKKVINHIDAGFTFDDGKITTHTDNFEFHKWAKQAFGTTGLLLGWTPFFKNKVRKKAMGNLEKFMNKNPVE